MAVGEKGRDQVLGIPGTLKNFLFEEQEGPKGVGILPGRKRKMISWRLWWFVERARGNGSVEEEDLLREIPGFGLKRLWAS